MGGAAASAMRGRSSPMALQSGACERVRCSAAEAAARRAARHRSCGDTEHRAPRWRCATPMPVLTATVATATPPLPASSAAHPPHRYLILPTRAPLSRTSPSQPHASPTPRRRQRRLSRQARLLHPSSPPSCCPPPPPLQWRLPRWASAPCRRPPLPPRPHHRHRQELVVPAVGGATQTQVQQAALRHAPEAAARVRHHRQAADQQPAAVHVRRAVGRRQLRADVKGPRLRAQQAAPSRAPPPRPRHTPGRRALHVQVHGVL